MASPFASDSEIVILNAPTLTDGGDPDVFFTKRTGTLPSGASRKPRYTIEVRSEPILLDLDEQNIGAQTAQAIRDLISDQIRLISEPVKASTLKARDKARRAFNEGASWAMKRYSGGRTGPREPKAGARFKYNDSGRLAEGVFMRPNPKDKTFTVNLPTNRLNPDVSGMATVMTWFRDLLRLVPALDPRKAVHYPVVGAALERDFADMVAKAESLQAAKLKMLAMKRRQALKQIALAAIEGLT